MRHEQSQDGHGLSMARVRATAGGYVYISIWGDGFDPASFCSSISVKASRGEVRQYRRPPVGASATSYWKSEKREFCEQEHQVFAEDVLIGLLKDLRPWLPKADGKQVSLSAHIVRFASKLADVRGNFVSRELVHLLDDFGADLDYDIVRHPSSAGQTRTATQKSAVFEAGE